MLSDHRPRQSVSLAASRGLHPDEPVWELRERIALNNKLPGAVPMRIQSIAVNRGDRLVWFDRVMGPEIAFNGDLIVFWAGFEYSAGEVAEIADRLREGKSEQVEPTRDLIGDYMKELDEQRQLAAHRTVIGPSVRIQRD